VNINEVGASLRRRWPVAAVLIALIPLVMVAYLVNRDVIRPPDRYTTSADVLIPARDEGGAAPEGVPPVLLQGQLELAQSTTIRDTALREADVGPDEAGRMAFDARLEKKDTIMRLSVAGPEPALAASVLDRYVDAYTNGRRDSVYQAAVDLQEIELRVIGVLQRKIREVELRLAAAKVAPPALVPDGGVLELPPGITSDAVLLAYQRNSLLNELQRRQVSFSLQATRAEIPAAFATVVQKRSAARVTPPPPSPLVPLLEILAGGLLLAVLVPVLIDRLDATITESRAASRALRARLLGTIPYVPRRLQDAYAPRGSSWDASFRTLAATSISTDQLPKAIVVTSPAGTAQDNVAANFAAGLARLGVTVALVGTVPRQDWYLNEIVEASDLPEDIYLDIDAPLDVEDAVPQGEEVDQAPPPTDDVAPAGFAGFGSASTGHQGDVAEAVTSEAPPRAEVAPVATSTLALSDVPTFPELLDAAHANRLGPDLRSRLATSAVEGLYVVPPGAEGDELRLDGLPPLLDALARSDIDITVLAGPGLLEDPNATIITWSTRHVLWAIEIGRVTTRDAQLAAERVELAGVEPFGVAVVSRMALKP
jgi:capsular polysaccharide biosynthesis protein